MSKATPATWRLLLAATWPGDRQLMMLCRGEALPGALADELLARGATLWNMYGPTETTIWSSIHAVSPGTVGLVPIGRPIANTEMYILDTQLQPMPPGVPGELHIGGAGLACGYLGRPELTAAHFIPTPFLGIEDGGWKIEDSRKSAARSSILDPRIGSIGQAAWPATSPMAPSPSWAGATSRSRSVACASSWARSKSRWPDTLPCER